MVRAATAIIALLCLSSCGQRCYDNSYANITDYNVSPNATTPGGIEVDTSDLPANLIEIDRQTEALEACLKMTVDRDCLTVLIAPDWYISECSGQQLFPCRINPDICRDKMRRDGMAEEEIEETLLVCPCACRATIQDENVVVATPNLLLYRAELARMLTGINNPWIPGISECLLDHSEE